jgi:hypothetical protein
LIRTKAKKKEEVKFLNFTGVKKQLGEGSSS